MKEDLLYKLDRGWLGWAEVQWIQILSLIVIFPLVGERGQASLNPIGDPPLSQISVVLQWGGGQSRDFWSFWEYIVLNVSLNYSKCF